jgi:hypothetical protein
MISLELIEAHSGYLKVQENENRFLTECWRLMDAIKNDVTNAFSSEMSSSEQVEHWGRVGIECSLIKDPFGQWVFFGIYCDPKDHKITFKAADEPEFAIFFDLEPSQRSMLASQSGIDTAIRELQDMGFESNFPKNTRNPWRLCYWRQSMRDFTTAEDSDLAELFRHQLTKLFESRFYKIAKNATT